MPKIVFVDSYYSEFLQEIEGRVPLGTYQQTLDWLMGFRFGTCDFYSRHLRDLGWYAVDIVTNFQPLQERWAKGNGSGYRGELKTAMQQIESAKADVVYMQSIHQFPADWLSSIRGRSKLVGQCSYATGWNWFRGYDAIFTSFPHYLKPIQEAGSRAYLVKLAFESSPDLLRVIPRDLPCSFVGGLGYPHIWKYGNDVLERIAQEIEGFRVWGYGRRALSERSAIRRAYQGTAWGNDMYNVYRRSRIVVNRHGEISGEYANNMRLYEATGCGAMLLTDRKSNLGEIFEVDKEVVAYDSPGDCLEKIRWYLAHPADLDRIAGAGQIRTLRDHTYKGRCVEMDKILKDLLEGKA